MRVLEVAPGVLEEILASLFLDFLERLRGL